MKHEESEILKGLGKNPGFKVPENYFEEFNKRMLDSLPAKEIKETKVISKPSMWVRVRPYVYMAAALTGIFGMMKVFNVFNGTEKTQISELAKGFEDSKNVDEFMMYGGASDYDIMVTYQDSVMNGLEKQDNALKQVAE